MKREAETVQVNGALRVRYHSNGSMTVLDGKDWLSALKITELEIQRLEGRMVKFLKLADDLRNQLRASMEEGPKAHIGAVKMNPQKPASVDCGEDLRPVKYCLKSLLL